MSDYILGLHVKFAIYYLGKIRYESSIISRFFEDNRVVALILDK